MALFISFEGGEGSGKSTQARRLAQLFERMGIRALSIHEPGTTNLGNRIRDIIKGNLGGSETISHRAELLLFSAARAELVAKVLSMHAKDPRMVIIADRYVDSTVAYQGYGRRLPMKLVDSVNSLATHGIMPDLTLLLDCPPADALRRVGAVQAELFEMGETRRIDDASARRFEDEPLAFHRRVREGYLKLADSQPERWVIVDGMEEEEEVFDSICRAIGGLKKFQDMFDKPVPLEDLSDTLDGSEHPLFSLSAEQPGR